MRSMLTAVMAAAAAAMLAAPTPASAAPKSVEVPHRISSLTGQPGDAANGRKLVIKQGGCLSCHVMPIPEQVDHGHIGPDLAGVAARLSEGEIRLRIVDPKIINPDTIMPAFYKSEGLNRVAAKWQGKTILTAAQVEDVVAYLMTLK